MEDRVVCFYCGTIYEAEDQKCPLCGGKTIAKAEDVHEPVQRRRITEQERKQRRRASKGGKFAASNQKKKDENSSTKMILVAALVFLALSVVVVTWFIGDMIGWWGGLEDSVQRQTQQASVAVNEECSLLKLSQDRVHLEQIGDTCSLTLTVNVESDEPVSITWPDAAIAKVEGKDELNVEDKQKSEDWVITAVSEGTTVMEFRCGEYTASCTIIVGEEPESTQPSEPTETQEEPAPDGFEPEMNITEDISLYFKGETLPLQILNLPDGATVTWISSDEAVAKVDENGVVTAVGSGSAMITAKVFDKTAQVLVRCPFDDTGDIGAHLTHTDVTISVGEVFYLYLLDSNDERITDVTYETSKDGICSVDNGKVTGVKGGNNVTITVTYGTHEYECIVRVRG